MRTLHSFPPPKDQNQSWGDKFWGFWDQCFRVRTRPRSNAIFLREESVEKHLNEHYHAAEATRSPHCSPRRATTKAPRASPFEEEGTRPRDPTRGAESQTTILTPIEET